MISRPRRPAMRSRHTVAAPNPWQDLALRYTALMAIYAFFLILALCAWFNFAIGALAPYWLLAPIFVWSIRYPSLMPGVLLFAVGLLSDIVIGTPLGVQAVGLLGMGVMGRLQQRYLQTQNFFAIWADYAALVLGYTIIVTGFVLLTLPEGASLGATATKALLSWATTILIFPPLALASHALVNWLQRTEQ